MATAAAEHEDAPESENVPGGLSGDRDIRMVDDVNDIGQMREINGTEGQAVVKTK